MTRSRDAGTPLAALWGMKFFLILTFVVAGAVGCKGNDAKNSGGTSEYVKLLEKAADETCACKDALCVSQVQAKYSKPLQEAMAKSSAHGEAADKASKRMGDCARKASGL